MPFPAFLRRSSSKDLGKDVPNHGTPSQAQAPNSEVSTKEQQKNQVNDTKGVKEVDVASEAQDQCQLKLDDVKTLFSGAPYFTLEKCDDGRTHPQALFPWNLELEIADLRDGKMIMHESFASATLHAHLPVSEMVNKQSPPTSPAEKGHVRKRPAFELGVFEVPNMLNYQGNEPGTIGMRHFLEIPVGDSLRTAKQAKEECLAMRNLQMVHLSSTEAFKAMQLGDQSTHIGKNASWHDRLNFVNDRKSWKELGVRDISMDVINARTAVIIPWYDKMAKDGWRGTILDEEDADTLYDELFTLLLYHPKKRAPGGKEAVDRGLGVQIEALANVLATPGAWFDFSLPESRLHLGEVLWEVPIDGKSDSISDSGAERHWLLVQILLSIELAIRLDAALRDQSVHHSEGDVIPVLRLFHSLRNRKVDWDLVLARGFLDDILVEDHTGAFPMTRPPMAKQPSTRVFSKWRNKMEARKSSEESSIWDFVIIPRHLETQVEGLLRFAEVLRWPNMEEFERGIRAKLQRWNTATTFDEWKSFVGPLQKRNAPSATHTRLPRSPLGKKMSGSDGLRVELRPASDVDSGGWLSRSWFAGLILPGQSISHFLISSLLENDKKSLEEIGCVANLYGGFVFNRQSWWSKDCIVGKVMAALDGGVECMGWIGTPQVHPLHYSRTPLQNGWLTVVSKPIPQPHTGPRINAGSAFAEDSNPVGRGRGKIMGSEFICVLDDSSTQQRDTVKFEALLLQITGTGDHLSASAEFIMSPASSAVPIKIQWELAHNVHFVSAYACRVPAMRMIPPSKHVEECSGHSPCEALRGHLLHKSYHYTVKHVSNLLEWVPPEINSSTGEGREVCIIDARGEKGQEVLARAWCSKVGRHALVSRVGRTCLSCSIREARALCIGVVIRIGQRE
jgi:hypothetical protein